MSGGRGFVFEHPKSATSWQLQEMQQLLSESGVGTTQLHMCAFGMTARDELGEAPVYKPTQLVSNVMPILQMMERKCPGGHRHVHLLSGKAAKAAIYPSKFCSALLDGYELWINEKKQRGAMELWRKRPGGRSVRQIRRRA